MSLSSLFAAGAVAVTVAMATVFLFAPKLWLVVLYAISLPACVLAYLLVSGQTGLDLLPAWLIRPLMYFTVAPAAVTAVMLVFAGGLSVRNAPLNRWFICNATYHLSWLFAAGCMVYAAMNDNFGAMWLHFLGGVYGMVMAAVARSKFTRPPAST